MSVRAKFNCVSVEPNPGGEGVDVLMRAVIGEEGDNAEWSKWTPTGELTMHVTNPSAAERFVPGWDYFIDISPDESSIPSEGAKD